MYQKQLRERLKKIQSELGTPLNIIAKNANVSVTTIWRFIRGESIRAETLERIDDFLTQYGF